jgi:hypothetical protein
MRFYHGFFSFVDDTVHAKRSLARSQRLPSLKSYAFTLVELMAVIGIIALLAVVGVPAMKGLTGSGGRKQALGQLLGALEIARNTAISTGTNAAVIFPAGTFPSIPYRYRSMAVISWQTTNTTGTNFMTGAWITLPQGIVFNSKQIDQLPYLTNATALIIPPNPQSTNFAMNTLQALVFQSDGALNDSYYTTAITSDGIAFFEGALDPSGTGTISSTGQKTNLVETIRITHFTGRPMPTLATNK